MNFRLRKWCAEDLEDLVKYANNYNIAKNLTNQFPYPYLKSDGENYLKMIACDTPVKIFAIEVEGHAVGSIGIFPQADIHCKNAEIGYWLAEPFWGKGIMPRAIEEIVKYGFETFDIDRVFARPFGRNKGSQRVLEKAGFVLEARFEKVLFKNKDYEDELIYAKRK